MALELFVIRHGQDEDNARGVCNGLRNRPLTALGRRQVHALADHIASSCLSFDAIYHSPLQRAVETAEIVCRHGLQGATVRLQALDTLVERNLGVLSGEPVAHIEKRCTPRVVYATYTCSRRGVLQAVYPTEVEGGESLTALLARAEHVLRFITRTHHDGRVLLVCHGGIATALYSAYYNITLEACLSMMHVGNADMLLLAPHSPVEATHVFIAEVDGG